MTRLDALAELRDLAHGLDADAPGVLRLLERTAEAGRGDVLRGLLVELGALAVLQGRPEDPARPASWPPAWWPEHGA